MEKTLERKEHQKLRLWYADAVVNPYMRNIYNEIETFRLGVEPAYIKIPFQMPLFQADEWKFIDALNAEGSFAMQDVASYNFLLTTAEETSLYYGEYSDRLPQILSKTNRRKVPLSELVCTNEDRFRKHFLRARGVILSMNYAPIVEVYDAEDDLMRRPLNISFYMRSGLEKCFTFGEFVHILGKSPIILEEQIRRYEVHRDD